MIPLFKVYMSPKAPEEVTKTLTSGFITQGPKVDAFESLLQTTLNTPYVLTLNSATSGLTMALKLLITPDPATHWPGIDLTQDIVLSTPLTCFATNASIIANHLPIQWVDTDPNTCNMCLLDLERKINHRTKVIYLVHWGGTPIDLHALRDILDRKEVELGFRPQVVQDAAHAFLSCFDNQNISNFNHITVYSLQAIKHLTTVDGGVITIPTKTLYDRAKLLRWYGIDRDQRNYNRKDLRLENDITEVGSKWHMNDVNATIGICNLDHIHTLIQKHRDHAAYYNQHLANLTTITLLTPPTLSQSSYWIYTIKVQNDLLQPFMEFMIQHGITTSQVHKRNDVHSCVSAFKSPLPQLDSLQDQYVCIPVGWWLTPQDLEHITKTIYAFDAEMQAN
mgnify:CR=1 FL=1